MRAARAVKDAVTHFVSDGKSETGGRNSVDQGCVNGEAASAGKLGPPGSEQQASAVEYFLQVMLPLLKPLVDDLCLRDPRTRSMALALWLLERSGAPGHILAELRAHCASPQCGPSPCTQLEARARQGEPEAMPPEPKPGGFQSGTAETESTPAAAQDAQPVPTRPLSAKKPEEEESPKKKAATFSDDSGNVVVPTRAPRQKGSRGSKDEEPRADSDKHVVIGGRSSIAIDKLDKAAGLEEPAEDSKPQRPTSAKRKKQANSMWKSGDEKEEDAGDCSDTESEDEPHSPAGDADQKRRSRLFSGASNASETSTAQNAATAARRSVLGNDPNKGGKPQRRFTVHLSKLTVPLPPAAEAMPLLRKVPAFAGFCDEDMEKVLQVARCNKFEVEENVLAHGATADEVHVVISGVGKVSVPYQIAEYKRGDVFGDEALRLAVQASQVQVSASGGPITTLSISRQDWLALDLKRTATTKAHSVANLRRERLKTTHKQDDATLEQAKKSGVCVDCGHPVLVDYVQTASDRDVITMSIKSNKMLGGVLELTEQQCNLIADSVYLISVQGGQTLMKIGDHGTALYIVQEGFLDVLVDDGQHVKLRTGDSFGELALLYDTPRSATINAAKDCLIWVLTRPDYKLITSLAYKARIEEYSGMLCQIPSLTNLVDETHMDMLADVLEKVTFYDCDDVCCEGEDEGLLFIIYEGECEEIVDDEVVRVVGKGHWVGEDQLLNNVPATVTLRPRDDVVTALVLDSSSLNTVAKVQQEMGKSTQWEKLRCCYKELAASRSTMVEELPYMEHFSKQDFTDEFLKKKMNKQLRKSAKLEGSVNGPMHDIGSTRRVGVLGEGSFGSVIMLLDEKTQESYALKILCKEQITRENLGKAVQNERSILLLLDSDFIVKLYQTYQDAQHLHFMLEPVLGGELFDVYTEQDLFGKMPEAKFFIACVTMGLQHMHAKRVVYRDLKLENCILNSEGYLKLTDMGIAKIVMGKTYTVCGTADYFAPETLRQIGHDRAVDWWASGVLLFIMATGKSPFDAPQVTQIYKNIMKGFSKVEFPSTVPSDCTEVIKSLCRKKPEERVPMQKGGVATLQEMPFFSSINFDKLTDKTLEPPIKMLPFDLEKISKKELSKKITLDMDAIEVWDGSLPSDDDPWGAAAES